MKKRIKTMCLLLCAALLFAGCSMQTVDKMYRLPKRSQDYNDLQSAVDAAMVNMEYSAPLSGENRQSIQAADLDGDGLREYLLFAKSADERPLKILIFRNTGEGVVHTDTIESNGTAFDQIEYAQMDEGTGVELIVGTRLSDQVLRSVSVYSFRDASAQQLVSVNYTKFIAADMDQNGYADLLVLRPGLEDGDNGVAEFYGIENGTVVRSNEANMSQPSERLKRIVVGKLHEGQMAVYAASTVDETAIVTDVYAVVDGKLSNLTFSNETGTSVQTMRNYYVYADDIDDDGIIELPSLMNAEQMKPEEAPDRQDLIRWYAMTIDGSEVDKMYTFHNFVNGWYLNLDSSLATGITVKNAGTSFEFYYLDGDDPEGIKLLTVYAFSGQNRDEQSMESGRFVLLKTESVTYSASLESIAETKGLSQENLINSFHLIQQDWKTGEM